MTECAPGCGACCDPVILSFMPEERLTGDNAAFARKHWTVLDDHPYLPEGAACAVRCDAFDHHTRNCTAYTNRPPICSGFPWYGRAPNREKGLNLACSFQADVRTVLPLVAVTQGRCASSSDLPGVASG